MAEPATATPRGRTDLRAVRRLGRQTTDENHEAPTGASLKGCVLGRASRSMRNSPPYALSVESPLGYKPPESMRASLPHSAFALTRVTSDGADLQRAHRKDEFPFPLDRRNADRGSPCKSSSRPDADQSTASSPLRRWLSRDFPWAHQLKEWQVRRQWPALRPHVAAGRLRVARADVWRDDPFRLFAAPASRVLCAQTDRCRDMSAAAQHSRRRSSHPPD